MEKGRRALRRAAMRGRLSMAGLLVGLAACGGGGGDGAPPAGTGEVASLANRCAPDNPFVRNAQGALPASLHEGTRTDELRFMRAYMKEVYLWPDEMPPLDPQTPAFQQTPFAQGMAAFFTESLSPTLTPGGQRRDRFSELVSTEYWKAVGEAGRAQNFGVEFVGLTTQAPWDIRAALVHAGSPAARAGVLRGERLREIETADGRRIDVVQASEQADLVLVDQLLRHTVANSQRVVMVFEKADGSSRRVSLTSTQYEEPPISAMQVLTAADGAKVGYVFINGFNLPLEDAMQKAFAELKAQGVRDLVVDLRYNGGGYAYQASQLAYMVAGAARTKDKVFEQVRYNSRREAETRADQSRFPFVSVTSGTPGTGTTAGRPLPSLDLKRVYVLTGPGSCSSSEAFINGLRGIDVEVVTIGGTTCGKPFGTIPRENCGLTYLPIETTAYNHKGQGDYVDGIAPSCPVADIFGKGTHTLGDPKERLLSMALLHRQTGACGAATADAGGGAEAAGASAKKGLAGEAERGTAGGEGWLIRPPIRQLKIGQPGE